MSNNLDAPGGVTAYRPVLARIPFRILELDPEKPANAEQLSPCELVPINLPRPDRLHDYRAKYVWNGVVVGNVGSVEFPLSIGTLLLAQLSNYRSGSAPIERLVSSSQAHRLECHTSIC